MKKKQPITLLDLMLQDEVIPTHRSCDNKLNPLGLSIMYEANNQPNETYVKQALFQDVLRNIEDKLYEIEKRLDNKEQLFYALRQPTFQREQRDQRFQDNSLDSSSQCPQVIASARIGYASSTGTKFHKHQRSKSSYSQNNITDQGSKRSQISCKITPTEEGIHNRLNVFEKKLHQMSENVSKIIASNDQFQRQIEQKLNQSLKEGELQLCSNRRTIDEYISSYKQANNNQAQLLHQIQQVKEQILVYQSNIQDEYKYPVSQLESTVRVINQLQNEHNQEIIVIKNQLSVIENDLLEILKNYKDLLINK